MLNELVRWNDLHPIFAQIYPRTIQDVMDNGILARVTYAGREFQIRPRKDGLDFDVYGPAFLMEAA